MGLPADAGRGPSGIVGRTEGGVVVPRFVVGGGPGTRKCVASADGWRRFLGLSDHAVTALSRLA